MKFIGFSPLYVCAATCLLGADPVEPPPSKLSARLASEIRSSLPKYEPPAEKSSSESPESPPDSDALVLPKVVVSERAPFRANPNELLTTKELDKKLAREFRNSLEGLDAVLNGFSIPLVSPSLAARGRAAYKARRLEDLNNSIQATKTADPKAGTELDKAVLDMQKALDWQNRLVQ